MPLNLHDLPPDVRLSLMMDAQAFADADRAGSTDSTDSTEKEEKRAKPHKMTADEARAEYWRVKAEVERQKLAKASPPPTPPKRSCRPSTAAVLIVEGVLTLIYFLFFVAAASGIWGRL